MRLLMVELGRFRSRRAVVLLVLAAALLTALVVGTTVWETRPVTDADLAAAQAQAEEEAQQPWVQEELQACLDDPAGWFGGEGTAADCEEATLPQPEWFLGRSVLDLSEQRYNSGTAVIVMSAGLMIIIGATFAGADWSSGSMSNQLLFRPRRAQVWVAKALAVLIASLVVTTLLVGAFWLSLHLVAEARGISTTAQAWEDIGWSAGRGVLLAAAGATGGFALTMLLRHTVGTLALLFAYTVGGEMLIAGLPIERAGHWTLSNNVSAWLQHGSSYYDYRLPCTDQDCDQMVQISFQHGAVYLGVLLAVVVVASVLMFRRRDVP